MPHESQEGVEEAGLLVEAGAVGPGEEGTLHRDRPETCHENSTK